MKFLTKLVYGALLCVYVAWCRPQGVLPISSFSPSAPSSGISSLFTTTTTPKPLIPIIRHINRVNNDGSYTFGYESGDGSYRVETRGLDGLIQGRYGYIDEHGVKKEVDYIAGSATGYEPRGQGITVPPRPPPKPPGQQSLDYDDGSGTTRAPTTTSTESGPLLVRTRARQRQFQAPRPTAPPPPPPTQPQITILTQPQSPPQPQPQPQPQHNTNFFQQFEPAPQQSALDFGQALQPSQPQPVFRPLSHVHGNSPIEQFLKQQLQQAQQQPQSQTHFF